MKAKLESVLCYVAFTAMGLFLGYCITASI